MYSVQIIQGSSVEYEAWAAQSLGSLGFSILWGTARAQWQDDQGRDVSELHIILLSRMSDVFPVISGHRRILNRHHVYQETPSTGDRARVTLEVQRYYSPYKDSLIIRLGGKHSQALLN